MMAVTIVARSYNLSRSLRSNVRGVVYFCDVSCRQVIVDYFRWRTVVNDARRMTRLATTANALF